MVDANVGPLVGLGLGGRLAGLLGGAAFRLLPLTDLEIVRHRFARGAVKYVFLVRAGAGR